jgi:hypothetical protein
MSTARWPRILLPAVLALLLAGCVSEQEIVAQQEQMLAAAGFRQQPANTPAWQNRMLMLPPHQLVTSPLPPNENGATGYVYADPDVCHCVWLGDARNYQAYAQLAFQQRLADERMQAAMLAAGPPPWAFWGPPPVVIIERHH